MTADVNGAAGANKTADNRTADNRTADNRTADNRTADNRIADSSGRASHPRGRTDARSHLAIALDIDDSVEALQLARAVAPYFGVAKVGLELYTASGPDAIGLLLDLGFDVFLDLKLHDIPNTVGRAARVAGGLGVRYLTIHAQGGVDMVRAGVEGMFSGASNGGFDAPCPLAVTVLTSDADAPRSVLVKRIMVAVEAGARGVVASASDVHDVHQLAPAMVTVVPGIRPTGAAVNDQARVATPTMAIAERADILVIGRPVTAAVDPVAASAVIAAEVSVALAAR